MKPMPSKSAEFEFDEIPNLVEILAARSQSIPDRMAFEFLGDQQNSPSLTFDQLDESARRIGAALQSRFEHGSPAALVFPPGLDFIKSFFGCVYAGVLPIPATYPKPRRPSARLSAIVSDARPSAILTTQRVIETLHDSTIASTLDRRSWLSIEELESCSADRWRQPDIDGDDVAFLQYTSGSTREPRGVEVSHSNIAHNLEMIRRGFGLSHADPGEPSEVGVSWLPAYHDMGLIGGILESLYVGGTTILMSPLSFLQRPERWLRAISKYRAVVSGGPNFAYELCLRKIKPQDVEPLDLSCWRVAFSGAEPIRAGTLRRFAEVFGRCGFSEEAFYPCYGLAEATLLVTGGNGPGDVKTCNLRATELQEQGRAVTVEPQSGSDGTSIELVGCGSPLLDEEILIVDPDTCLPCEDEVVGEIWIRGRNVARGYRDFAPEDGPFQGRVKGSTGQPYLKSGDLGFIREGSLFVTGRRSELLIIRGRNHYPHDLEATVQESDEMLIPGGGAAFLVERQDDELLVLVQEVDRASDPAQRDAMIGAIRRNVTAEHEVFVHEVILIRMGTLPRTTSGKVRYSAVKGQYLDDELSVLSRWSFARSSGRPTKPGDVRDQDASTSLVRLLDLPKTSDREALAGEIEARLMTWLKEAADVQGEDLDPNRPFADYGLDSLSAVELTSQLEEGLELTLSPTIAWTYPNPAALAGHLSELMTAGEVADTAPEPDNCETDRFDQLLSQLEQMPEDEVAALLASENRPGAT